uniref:Sigma intracellular receptor 2 n=1 Tax=Saccoglossus kowalevskii TaxID=10224 RepID=A0ABM0LTP0_SACKO|nr:PREDICTED: transmembrane protein 97-like [Saccoglossus kowalevskii]
MEFFWRILHPHIPITILIDSQSVLPKEWYPNVLRNTLEWYCREFKDPMMMDPPSWFQAFCVCELLFQFPFFFVATKSFFKGSAKHLRIPLLIYSSHVATTVIAILCHILFHDFSSGDYPGPSTLNERLFLAAIYSPYLIVPVMILLTMLYSQEYNSDSKKFM